jgi:hypothetical protein
MREATGNQPEIAPNARSLGVRRDIDLPVAAGWVRPGTGGLSVAPDRPDHLPSHRRPPTLGGTGKDPVWELDLACLGNRLAFRQDKIEHGMIEPAWRMTLDDYVESLAATAPYWKKR